jgi:hypothetical protein
VAPAPLAGLDWLERGDLVAQGGAVLLSNLPRHIGERAGEDRCVVAVG